MKVDSEGVHSVNLFSSDGNLNDVIDPICKNDIIQYNHVYKDANGGVHNELKLLRYKGVNRTQFVLTADEISKMEVIPKKPYFVKVPFTFPGKNKVDGSQNVPEGYNYSVQITQQDTSVTFVIVIPMTEGNAQYVNNDDYGIPTSVFTEAALYINGRIFSSKTSRFCLRKSSCSCFIVSFAKRTKSCFISSCKEL